MPSEAMSDRTDDDLIVAAVASYAKMDPAAPQPSLAGSDVEAADGVRHVLLRNSGGLLAVYRQQADGWLRRLEVWPEQFDS